MNENELLAQIAREGKTAAQVALEIGVSKSAFYRKINRKVEFTRAEIEKLIRNLHLDQSTTYRIFFAG